jgi:hypothetical protein
MLCRVCFLGFRASDFFWSVGLSHLVDRRSKLRPEEQEALDCEYNVRANESDAFSHLQPQQQQELSKRTFNASAPPPRAARHSEGLRELNELDSLHNGNLSLWFSRQHRYLVSSKEV